MPDTAPYAVIHHDDQILLFTSTPPVQRQTLTGLQVWRSADGLEWEPLGTVIEEGSQIDYVTSTALGLVAIGSAGHDERVRVWLSADGVEWLALMDGVPIDTSGLVPLPDTNSVAGEGDMMTEGIEAAIGSDGQVILTELSGERAFALVARPPDRNRPFDIATFEIWTAGLTE